MGIFLQFSPQNSDKNQWRQTQTSVFETFVGTGSARTSLSCYLNEPVQVSGSMLCIFQHTTGHGNEGLGRKASQFKTLKAKER